MEVPCSHKFQRGKELLAHICGGVDQKVGNGNPGSAPAPICFDRETLPDLLVRGLVRVFNGLNLLHYLLADGVLLTTKSKVKGNGRPSLYRCRMPSLAQASIVQSM